MKIIFLYFIVVTLSFTKIRDGFSGFSVSSNLGLLPQGKRKQNSFRESHKLNITAYRQQVIKKLTVTLKGKMNFNGFPQLPVILGPHKLRSTDCKLS